MGERRRNRRASVAFHPWELLRFFILSTMSVAMQMTSLRQALVITIVTVLTSCGYGGTYSPSVSVSEELSASSFQEQLHAYGIPLTLPDGRAILVNIPSYELIAFEDGKPVFRSRVIVGKPETPTPTIDTVTSSVVFWPSWRPTPDMIASGEVPDRVFPPGPGNPMGALVVTLDSRWGIAMHDTNQRHLFERERRAYSHGCIRVERWDKLAAWLLDRDENWIRAMAAGPKTQRVSTPRVPVLIRYLTSFPATDGTLQMYSDVYGLKLDEATKLASANTLASSTASFGHGTCQIPE